MLAVVLLLTTAFSMNIIAGAASFTPRFECPSYDNPYYFSDMNLYYDAGWGMPNCTAYAYGRAYEITGKEPKLCPYNAELWYGYNQNYGYYNYGQTPAIGAIACWSYSYGGGHVAVVEQINDDGTIVMSNSAYSGTMFYVSYADVNDPHMGGYSSWYFQGFIYVYQQPDEDVDIVEPADYDAGAYSVSVSSLTLRKSAGTSSTALGYLSRDTKINVSETKKVGGYTWGKTTYKGKEGWVALQYCEFISYDFIEETTVAPTTVAPTTVAPTTVAPTTVQPTTVAPTTVQPTTVQPTTAAPTTVAPTTVPVTEPVETKTQGLGVGDVNADGRIDITDATAIQKYVAGVLKLSEEEVKWCDFDFDGQVTIVDATCLQHYLTYAHLVYNR